MWSQMTVGVLRFGFGSVVLTTTDIESMGDNGAWHFRGKVQRDVYRNISLAYLVSK